MELAFIKVTSRQIVPKLLKYLGEVQPFLRKLSSKRPLTHSQIAGNVSREHSSVRKCLQRTRMPMNHRSEGTSEMARFAGTKLEFDADKDEFALNVDARELPLANSDNHLNDLLLKYCEAALASRREEMSQLRTRVEHAISSLPSLNRQSCDRDYNSRKERADAAEHQNIVDFDHGIFPLMVSATVVQRRHSCNRLSATGLGQS
jgi:hypothetical protein